MQHLHHHQIPLRRLPPRPVPDLLSVDKRRPHRLLKKLRLALALLLVPLLALERDTDQPRRAHVGHELGGGHGQLEQEERDAAGAVLDGEGNAGLAVSVERAGETSGAGYVVGAGAMDVDAVAESGGGDEDGACTESGTEDGTEDAEELGRPTEVSAG